MPGRCPIDRRRTCCHVCTHYLGECPALAADTERAFCATLKAEPCDRRCGECRGFERVKK